MILCQKSGENVAVPIQKNRVALPRRHNLLKEGSWRSYRGRRVRARLCTLGTQRPRDAEGSIPAGGGGGEGTYTREEEPAELIYFKVYKSKISVIEQAIETAALCWVRTNRAVTVWR